MFNILQLLKEILMYKMIHKKNLQRDLKRSRSTLRQVWMMKNQSAIMITIQHRLKLKPRMLLPEQLWLWKTKWSLHIQSISLLILAQLKHYQILKIQIGLHRSSSPLIMLPTRPIFQRLKRKREKSPLKKVNLLKNLQRVQQKWVTSSMKKHMGYKSQKVKILNLAIGNILLNFQAQFSLRIWVENLRRRSMLEA